MTKVFRLKVVLALLTLALVGSSAVRANAQGLTGQIGGSVVDSSNAPVPGAMVVARNTATAVTREVITDGQGLFVITNIFAGTYDLRVSLAGFAPHEQRGIILSAAERLSLAPIVLQIEGVGEQVLVETAALRASTQSGERSNVIRADEIQDVGLRGRDFLGLLQAMPGVVDGGTSGSGARDAPGWNAFLGTEINGLRDQFMGMSYDGVSSKDTGFGAANYVTPSLDSIAEVKIQTSNYQAEYGRAGGANIIVVTKSGSSRFSGSGAYYKRHEALNSNTWSRRRTCDAAALANPNAPPHADCSTPRYRYDNSAFTLGGPVLIPGTGFNQDRDKLFFFYSLDVLPRTDPFSVNSTFPTAAERNGDFSATVNSSNQLRFIRDPSLAPLTCNVNSGGPGCFPGNVIPQDRIHPVGRQMLNIFPLPQDLWLTPEGRALSAGQYNYQFTGDTEKSRTDNVVRIDWNIRPGTTFYTRFQKGTEVFGRGYFNQATPALIAGNGLGWAQSRGSYDIYTTGYVSTLVHTFTPTTVLEVIAGTNWAEQNAEPVSQADWDAISYPVVVPSHTQVFPDNNPGRVIPSMSFAGSNALPNTRNISIGNQPWNATNPTHNFSVNMTHLRGSHNLKAGFFIELTSRPQDQATNAGSYSFNASADNPLDTNLGWANALLGHLNSYSEGNTNIRTIPSFKQPEFFVQDNWRVSRRFTLDLGVRFSHVGVSYQRGREIGWFDPAAWRPENAVSLWTPHCLTTAPCSGVNRVARNPITGEIRNNPAWIGQIVEGSGDRNNGTVFGTGLPDPYPSPGISTAPRIGFGWDVTGDGKTAVRGGFGTSYTRLGDGQFGNFTGVTNPPGVSLSWLTIDERATAPSLVGVLGGTIVPNDIRPITVHTWSLGVQRELPWRLLADVAYIGNDTRNSWAVNSSGAYSLPHNSIAPTELVNPRPEWFDPTLNNTIYQDNFIRPNYPGRGAISQTIFRDDMYRKVHGIQLEIRRRLSNGFAWSANYTSTVVRQFQAFDYFRTLEDNQRRHMHNNGGRPHLAKFTYNWMIPGASRLLGNNPVAAAVLDGWQLSGLTQYVGGTWGNFGYSFTGIPTGTSLNLLAGGLQTDRVFIVCDPNLPRSERTFDRQYRTECVQPPGPLTDPNDVLYQGGAGRGTQDIRMNLGYVNSDLTLLKNFSLGNRRNLQVRLEAYNVLNSTQYTSVNTNATFNFVTGQQTNAEFGRITGVRNGSNRVMQAGVRLTF